MGFTFIFKRSFKESIEVKTVQTGTSSRFYSFVDEGKVYEIITSNHLSATAMQNQLQLIGLLDRLIRQAYSTGFFDKKKIHSTIIKLNKITTALCSGL